MISYFENRCVLLQFDCSDSRGQFLVLCEYQAEFLSARFRTTRYVYIYTGAVQQDVLYGTALSGNVP